MIKVNNVLMEIVVLILVVLVVLGIGIYNVVMLDKKVVILEEQVGNLEQELVEKTGKIANYEERLKLLESKEESNIEEKEKQDKKEEKKNPKYTTFEATGYTAKCKGCSGVTKSGYNVRNTIYYDGMRIVAVDPSVIPLHSIVEVKNGNEVFKAIALNVGGAIKNYKIDILFKTREEALKFGRKHVELRVLRNGK